MITSTIKTDRKPTIDNLLLDVSDNKLTKDSLYWLLDSEQISLETYEAVLKVMILNDIDTEEQPEISWGQYCTEQSHIQLFEEEEKYFELLNKKAPLLKIDSNLFEKVNVILMTSIFSYCFLTTLFI